MITASHDLYAEHSGEPAPDSTAASEVNIHDDELGAATRTPRPVFGAYADAEGKLRALIDLISSFSVLAGHEDTSVGQVVVARAAIEAAARMYWGLAATTTENERPVGFENGSARWGRTPATVEYDDCSFRKLTIAFEAARPRAPLRTTGVEP